MSLKAAIFDFDGVILDTETTEFEALSEIYREHGAELKFEDWSPCVGTSNVFDPYAHLEDVIRKPVEREALRERFRLRQRELVTRSDLMPGIMDRLREARGLGIALAIASSSRTDWVEPHLCKRELSSYFDFVSCREGGIGAKPAPDVYLAALAGLKVSPGEAVAFEDSTNGVMSARAAGVFVVAVPNSVTRRLDLSGADRVVGSLADITLKEIDAAMSAKGVRA